MNGEAKVRQLAQALALKTVQLEKAVTLAGKAAEDLKKYREMTGNLDGLRQVLFHQRTHHHKHCKHEGCAWDLGTLAFLAHSMGMTKENFQGDVLLGMIEQYDAQHDKQEMGHVHQFPKGVTDARRSVPKAGEAEPAEDTGPATGSVPESPAGADVPGSRPDRATTRRLPDKPGSTPKRE